MLSCDYIQELYADFTVQEIGESVKEKRAEAPVEYWKIFCSLYVRVGILTEVFNNAESKWQFSLLWEVDIAHPFC